MMVEHHKIEANRLGYFHIGVYNVNCPGGGERIDRLSWKDMPMEVARKWRWYFEYRACLLQIKYPKFRVERHWGVTDTHAIYDAKRYRNMLITKKRKITEISNKLHLARKHWGDVVPLKELYPIEDDDKYKKAEAKLNKYKKELENLINNKDNKELWV